MKQEPEDSARSEIVAQRELRISVSEIGDRIGATRETVAQWLALVAESAADAPPISNCEVIAQLADSVFIGDDLVFFEIIKDHPQVIRWSNPAASNGADQLAALHDALLVQASMRRNTLSSGSQVVLVLSDLSVIDCEALHALIVGADELIIVASRTTLRSILRSSKNALC